jgi:hypothetical protein
MTINLDPGLVSLGLPPAEVIDALIAGVVRIKRRAELYESDGETPFDINRWDARLTGGTITVDRDRNERRMCDLNFENNDNSLDIDAVQGFWYDKIIKTFWGIRYNNESGPAFWEMQIGEFMIDRITEGRFPHVARITGRDYTKKCLNTKIGSSVQFPSGTPVESIVRALAANSGITKFRLPYTGLSYDRDAVFERGTDRWKIMHDIADSIAYEVYFTADGYLTMRPYPDPTFSPVRWIFRGGTLDGTLVDYELSANDSRIKNKIIVVGTSSTSSIGISRTVYAEAANNDVNSPTRIARIGERTEFIESDYYTTDEQALNFCNARLAVSALEEFDMNFSSMIIPWLDAGDIVDVHDDADPSTYVPRRFLLSNFSLPLSLGPMTALGRRITLVGVTENLEYQ